LSRLWRNGKVSSDDRDNLSLFLKPAVAVRDWPGRLLLSAFCYSRIFVRASF
jgi:hypothetical protein